MLKFTGIEYLYRNDNYVIQSFERTSLTTMGIQPHSQCGLFSRELRTNPYFHID